ncbi:GNAT family N-acetyltransferase, partial [Thermodesulfobacteriota bacterium]
MFEDYPRETVVKSGACILLNPLVTDDKDRLVDFFSRIPEEELWFLRADLSDPEEILRWCEELDYDRIVPVAAINPEDDAIVALLRLYRRPSKCMRHIAHLRILVDPAFRHQRLGTWMLLDSFKLAMDMGIEKLVAEFVVGVEES